MVGWRLMEAAVDSTMAIAFGETVRLSFLKGGVVDPARPQRDVRAVLHVGGDDSANQAAVENFRTRLSQGKAELFLNRATYTGPSIAAGDRVRASDRMGQPWFRVMSVSDKYSNMIVASLSE